MPYALTDDQAYDHPKFVACSDAAAGLWWKGLGWCCRHLTDGHITRSTFLRISSAGTKAVDRCITELLTSGLLEETESGLYFHDFDHHNPSGSEVRRKRAEVSEAKSRAGKKGAEARWGHGKADGKPIADGMANGWQNDGPVPVPVPPLLTTTDSTSGRSAGLPSPTNEVVGVCERCDCPTDRPGAYTANGVDVICDHVIDADAFLA